MAGRRPSREAVTRAAATLLAVLAEAGQRDRAVAAAAYTAGLALVVPDATLPFAPVPVVRLERVWPILDGLAGQEKELLVTGVVTVTSHDGVMTVTEVELLRTVCALLHCPLPPLAQASPEQVTQ